jgi:hypothetical protein
LERRVVQQGGVRIGIEQCAECTIPVYDRAGGGVHDEDPFRQGIQQFDEGRRHAFTVGGGEGVKEYVSLRMGQAILT